MRAVVVTANHFWLDGIVAGLLVVMVLGLQRLMRGLRPGKPSGPAPVASVRGELSVRP